MSKVISFRLDQANPREAQALRVLNVWIEKGFSVRFILTKSLLELDYSGSDIEIKQDDQSLDVVKDHLEQVLEIVKSINANLITGQCPKSNQLNLNGNFLNLYRLFKCNW